jgi:D-alanyl-D-alanine carboxypeptidase
MVPASRYDTPLLDENPDGFPDIDGQSFLLYDALSDTFLVGKNCDDATDPAGITMIMTMILALENLKTDNMITITAEMIDYIPDEYVRLGLVVGEEISVRDCIFASLLISANDACSALAFEIAGSREEFSELMNARATELGCYNTHFTNPFGYSDVEHRTTAHDMALMMKKALEFDLFIEASATQTYIVMPTNTYSDKRTLNNGNRFVSTTTYSYDNYIAGKTGHSDLFGHSIVAAAESDGRTLIGVIFGASASEVRYSNLVEMFEYGFSQYTTTFNDVSEYETAITDVINQINITVKEVGMKTTETVTDLQPFITVPSSRSLGGYSTGLDLSNVAVNPNVDVQTLRIPIYRRYSDGTDMVVGALNVTVAKESAVIDKVSDKSEQSQRVKELIRKIIVILLMLSALLIAFVVFMRIQKRRKSLLNRKNTKVL